MDETTETIEAEISTVIEENQEQEEYPILEDVLRWRMQVEEMRKKLFADSRRKIKGPQIPKFNTGPIEEIKLSEYFDGIHNYVTSDKEKGPLDAFFDED